MELKGLRLGCCEGLKIVRKGVSRPSVGTRERVEITDCAMITGAAFLRRDASVFSFRG